MEIRSKREFYRLWHAGLLGNRPHVFTNIHDALALGAPTVGFREVGGGAHGGKFELVPRSEALATAARWDAEGRKYSLDSAVPNPEVTLIGEVCQTWRGLEGFLAIRSKLPMRATAAAGLFRSYQGLTVHLLLREFMDPSSRDDLDALFDLYPDAAVEFACFPHNLGIFPHRNTVIWEVRNY